MTIILETRLKEFETLLDQYDRASTFTEINELSKKVVNAAKNVLAEIKKNSTEETMMLMSSVTNRMETAFACKEKQIKKANEHLEHAQIRMEFNLTGIKKI